MHPLALFQFRNRRVQSGLEDAAAAIRRDDLATVEERREDSVRAERGRKEIERIGTCSSATGFLRCRFGRRTHAFVNIMSVAPSVQRVEKGLW